MGFLSHDTSPL